MVVRLTDQVCNSRRRATRRGIRRAGRSDSAVCRARLDSSTEGPRGSMVVGHQDPGRHLLARRPDLNGLMVSIGAEPDGTGYWAAALGGGVFRLRRSTLALLDERLIPLQPASLVARRQRADTGETAAATGDFADAQAPTRSSWMSRSNSRIVSAVSDTAPGAGSALRPAHSREPSSRFGCVRSARWSGPLRSSSGPDRTSGDRLERDSGGVGSRT
jgi:hypothetical protein